MRSPPLSPSQRAYTFQQEKFLAGIAERAARLFEDGYTLEVGDRFHEFLVTPPNRNIPYVVNALHQTCTCCFYRRQVEGEPLTRDGTMVSCKHLLGLKALIRAEGRRLQEEQRWCCFYRLRLHWIETLYAQCVEEQQRCQQEAQNNKAPSPTPRCRHCAASGSICDSTTRMNTKGEQTR